MKTRLYSKTSNHRYLRNKTNSSISKKHNDSDPNDLAELYNYELQHVLDKHAPEDVLDKHAPEVHRSITLRPHAPWFTDELWDAKREKRRCKRAYRASGLEVHKQIYREQCRRYIAMLDQCKSKYYQFKIEIADQRKLFHMIDGMFSVEPFPLFPSNTSVQELTERFSAHFTNKIANLKHALLILFQLELWKPVQRS